jgi:glutamate-5-semialdehyde dehydrogenase
VPEVSAPGRLGGVNDAEELQTLVPGQAIPYGGNRVARVSEALAAAFEPGDHLVVVQETGDLLHVPAGEHARVEHAVGDALAAFHALTGVSDEQITCFFEEFASRLEDEAAFGAIAQANAADVEGARARGRSTTRLELSARMRDDMIGALRMWRDLPGGRDQLVERVDHDEWSVEARRAPLGVVGFVFEGRPNVFADATGVLRTGNTVVFRIGSDALGTARAITQHALLPALRSSGLPDGAVQLVDSAAHAAGWALFSDRRVALAVARGSGPAVAQLGAVARQAGVPVSLHGTGGAWLIAGCSAEPGWLLAAVVHSLDRKVCNTANVLVVVRDQAEWAVPHVLDAARAAGERRSAPTRFHIVDGSQQWVPAEWFTETIEVRRPEGARTEPRADVVPVDALATEWEWEDNPEVTLVVAESLGHAVDLCNTYSPRFTVSIISDDPDEQAFVWSHADAPFVGNGITRWVDGQFALSRPELGLSNWQAGRLFARAGVLSGDSVHTVRLRAVQADTTLCR